MKKVLKDIQHPSVHLASSPKGISCEGFLRKTNECKLEPKERRDYGCMHSLLLPEVQPENKIRTREVQ
jgi:hypothetical protein